MKQDPILLKLLRDAGFVEKESYVYLALLEAGQGSVYDIAKISGLKRPIIYVILEGLIEKGYVSEIPNQKIHTYKAADPSIIASKIQTTAKHFTEMLPVFKTLANKGGKRPKITYLETKEAIQKIFAEINRQKSAVFIASLAEVEKHFPGSVEEWKTSYKKGYNKLVSRTLIPNNKEDIEIVKSFKKITDKIEIKYLENMEEFGMDITVYGNKITITTFEDKPFMVVIESEAVPKFFLPIFENLWKDGKEIK